MKHSASGILLIRHASSAPDDNLPEADWPLSADGEAQALALAENLAGIGIERIFSSPYRRAVDTVRPLAERLELPVELVSDLRERKLTDGPRADWKDVVRQAWTDFSFALPGCESGLIAQARICRAVREIAVRHPGQRIAIASHGNVIGLFLNVIDPGFGFAQWQAIKNPDVFHLTWDGAAWHRSAETHFPA